MFLNYLSIFLSDGLMYSLLAMGFYVSYSTLDFPDLSVEGTVLTGGLVFSLLCNHITPYLALVAALLAGAAAGNNAQYVTMLGRDPGQSKILGLAIGNGYAAVAGALIVQSRGSATQDMGLGMIVIGLASVIIGLSLFGRIRFLRPTTRVILGSILYQACLVLASAIGLPSAYNKLLMAALFTVALVLSSIQKKGKKVAV